MRILIPYDGSDTSLAALEYAIKHFADAEIMALHVINENYIDNPYGQLLVGREKLRDRGKEEANDLLAEAETAAKEADVDIDTDVVIGHPVRGILDYVDENQIDQVIMGGRGLSNAPRLLLGSVSFGVVLHADIPVTIIR